MNKRAGFEEDTKLSVFKETNKNEVEKIMRLEEPICEVMTIESIFIIPIVFNKIIFMLRSYKTQRTERY